MTSWLRKLFTGEKRLDAVKYPSAQFATQVDAIAALLDWCTGKYDWASFDARESPGTKWITVEICDEQINTLTEPVDLKKLLQEAGLPALAEVVRPADEAEQRRRQAREDLEQPIQFTLHELEGATHAELAEAVHAIFRFHFGLSPMYQLVGRIED